MRQSPPNQAPVPISFHEFLHRTKFQRTDVQPNTNTFRAGRGLGTTNWKMPAVSLMADLWVRFVVPVTIAVGEGGSITGGTWGDVSRMVRHVAFKNTQSYNMRDLEGQSWARWARRRYRGGLNLSDQLPWQGVAPSSNYSAALLGNTLPGSPDLGNPQRGEAVQALTYNLTFTYPMPLAFTHAGARGLLFAANQGIDYNLTVDWADFVGDIGATGGSSDLINGLTGTDLSITVGTPSFDLTVEYANVPFDDQGQSMKNRLQRFTSDYVAVADKRMPITQTGRTSFDLTKTENFTSVVVYLFNGDVPIDPSKVTDIEWRYGAQATDVSRESASMNIVRQAWLDGAVPQDTGLHFDLNHRLMQNQPDDYDAFFAQKLAELSIDFTIAGDVSLSNAYALCVYESLLPFQQQIGG